MWQTVRFRITAVAVVVVTLALTGVGVVLVLRQQAALTATLDRGLSQRADDIEGLLVESGPPGQFASIGDEGFVQLVSDGGTVVASTPNLAGLPPLELPTELDSDVIGTIDGLPVDDDAFRVLGRRIGVLELQVGTTYDVVSESTAALAGSLALTIPVVVGLLAGLMWVSVGRTLMPVESIRTQVASIGASDLSHRVPAPGTGDEIDRLAATMNRMLERLESSVGRQQRFVADASHELRIPLTRLRGELELILGATADQPDRGFLGSLYDEVLSMQQTIEDLLYLARLDETGDNPATTLDLDDVVLEQVHKMRADAGEVEVRLGRVSAVMVAGSRSGLARALGNLLANARRHAAAAVSVSLVETGGEAVISVKDDGTGVPADAADRIFERFGRADEARSASLGGTGLGLAIARDIIERHGGRLILTNPGEPGAEFQIRLPAAT